MSDHKIRKKKEKRKHQNVSITCCGKCHYPYIMGNVECVKCGEPYQLSEASRKHIMSQKKRGGLEGGE